MNKLTYERKQILLNRLDTLKSTLKAQSNAGNGCDVHELAQMIQLAEGISGLIDKDRDSEKIESLIDRLWNRSVAYFTKKYEHHYHSKSRYV